MANSKVGVLGMASGVGFGEGLGPGLYGHVTPEKVQPAQGASRGGGCCGS